MGLFNWFGKEDAPELNLPEAPNFLSADELLQSGVDFGQAQMPLALGSREWALDILQDPTKLTNFFEQLQPTSLEAALANQTFANIMPNVERGIKHNLSLSGMDSSPILAQQIGKAQGNLGVDIGNILAQLGQTRGAASLQAGLNIDPLAQIIGPVGEFGQQQDYTQKMTEYQRALAQAQINYQQQMEEYQKMMERGRRVGALTGPIGGYITGGGEGAVDAGLSMAELIAKMGTGGMFGGGQQQTLSGYPVQYSSSLFGNQQQSPVFGQTQQYGNIFGNQQTGFNQQALLNSLQSVFI